MAKTKAIIFDLDGVLFDTSDAHKEAFQRTLAPLGVREVRYQRIAGMRTDDAITFLTSEVEQHLTKDQVVELSAVKRKLARELIAVRAGVFAGSSEAVRLLSQRYSLGLASSSGSHNIAQYFAAAGTRDCFVSVISGDDVVAAKPDPEIFLSSLKNMSVSADEAVVVEDSASGILAGIGAGIRVIGVSGMLTEEHLRSLGVFCVIRSVSELPHIL